ncbi:preprotein translocase subunit SecA [Lactococcus hircilactis]|uniref:Protein translocase subunit SecA n=1 Tax=Lactococcus hircilactis TaxID=1494462 RepID=A0A7X2CZX1_9LACT|nr:preprotein translocase subunit SecA [Lactococcus hircilactis]MQW39084.1 preprotein translocase subunit SecA [Lactococcus hircilactis]
MLKMQKYEKLATKIEQLLPAYSVMADDVLQQQTEVLKTLLSDGKTIVDILPHAFAVVIEADKRVLGLTPYHVQILGGLALFFGNIAEIKTGEGKTLVATMPLYARALEGKKGNFLITANEYLAERDGQEMGKVFEWLNLSVGIGAGDEDQDIEKKLHLYNSDIIYTTHSKLGFDYLFDNLGSELSEQVVSQFNFAIIDEIDAVLLDGAQTALVISGSPKVQSNYYQICDWFVKSLAHDDFEYSDDKRRLWITDKGLEKVEQYFDIKNIFSKKYSDLYRHIVLALQANYLKKKEKDYVVIDGKVLLLDVVNGRTMPGVKLQGGIHQAIEMKEGVEVSNETKTLGTISYQSLFKKFKRLSGMTGTAKTDEKEFMETYHLQVIEIPTHLPTQREDKPDQIYVTNQVKIEESIRAVKKGILEERPVLIETGSVSMSDLYSLVLLQNKIPHNLLNARTVAREQQIINDAGRIGAVTLATSMAGRGTDIKLTPQAKMNGGLKVIGTERMNNKRIDNQLRGRAGRQGEPGEAVFYVSLEDKVIIENAPNWVRKARISLSNKILEGERSSEDKIHQYRLKRVMDKAQKKLSNAEFQSRKNTLAFDTILSDQRNRIYEARNKVMSENENYLEEIIIQSAQQMISNFVNNTVLSLQNISDFIFNNIKSDYLLNEIERNLNQMHHKKEIQEYLHRLANQYILESFHRIKDPIQLRYFKKVIILRAIDSAWVEQLDYLQQLKNLVNGRSMAQHKPVNEFGREARHHFFEMEDQIYTSIFRCITLSELKMKEDGTIDIEFP